MLTRLCCVKNVCCLSPVPFKPMTRPYPASELLRTPVKCATSLMREAADAGRGMVKNIRAVTRTERKFMDLERKYVFEDFGKKSRLVGIANDPFSIKVNFHI